MNRLNRGYGNKERNCKLWGGGAREKEHAMYNRSGKNKGVVRCLLHTVIHLYYTIQFCTETVW